MVFSMLYYVSSLCTCVSMLTSRVCANRPSYITTFFHHGLEYHRTCSVSLAVISDILPCILHSQKTAYALHTLHSLGSITFPYTPAPPPGICYVYPFTWHIRGTHIHICPLPPTRTCTHTHTYNCTHVYTHTRHA